ncbi:MAG TPA: hypothetical protein VD948_07550 [Rhodothermales bacterium]|nr:hypothetical protein [Rhodothermales bacterium]
MIDSSRLVTFFLLCSRGVCDVFTAALREHHFANAVRHFDDVAQITAKLERMRDSSQVVVLIDGADEDALDALRALKASDFNHVPVVLVGGKDQARAAYDAGANAVLAREVWEGDIARVTRAVGSFWIRLVKRPPVYR